MRSKSLALVLCMSAMLSACDAWPMEFENDSKDHIEFQYLHKDYSDWSANLPYDAGGNSLLQRAHYFKDVRGLRIRDGGKMFQVSPAELARFHSICDRADVCTIIYDGNGRIRVVPR